MEIKQISTTLSNNKDYGKKDVLTIKIYDGLFNSHLLKSLFSYTDNISWQFDSEYTDDDPFSMKFWGFPIMTDNDLSMI